MLTTTAKPSTHSAHDLATVMISAWGVGTSAATVRGMIAALRRRRPSGPIPGLLALSPAHQEARAAEAWYEECSLLVRQTGPGRLRPAAWDELQTTKSASFTAWLESIRTSRPAPLTAKRKGIDLHTIERTRYSTAKRARHDKQFRRQWLRRLAAEEERLLYRTPDPDMEAATMARVREIAKLRTIAGAKCATKSRTWISRTDAQAMIRTAATDSGLLDNWDGISFCADRGDHHSLDIADIIYGPAAGPYHAVRNVLGLVIQTKRRVYGGHSWRISNRTDTFLAGYNENGNPFLHQVPNTITSVAEAWEWIWDYRNITLRQGDIGLAPISGLSRVIPAERLAYVDVAGHSRHKFFGTIAYHKGALLISDGFLIHEGDQHPTIAVARNTWYRVVVARRSERGQSTKD